MPDNEAAAVVAKTSIKPYKLKPSVGDTLTRDDLSTWREVQLCYMRQNDAWKPFLPGGTRSEWKAEDSGEANEGWSENEKASLPDFITCLSTFSPVGCGETIKRESTSFNWVIDLIKETFGLKTRGEHFLGLDDISFNFSSGFTYQQAYMQIKDFICAGLLSQQDRFEGKPLPQKETLSPVAKNFICKEWLMKIDPRLPKHIRDTRGHLFTDDKPTLACNQKILCEQMPTMLAELDEKTDTTAVDAVTMGYVPANRRNPARGRGRGVLRGAGAFRGFSNYQPRALMPPTRSSYPQGCQRCIEAIPARLDASKTHATKDCLWPPNSNQNQTYNPRPNFRVILVPESQSSAEEYFDQTDVFSNQFYDDTAIEEINDNDANKDSSYYSPCFQSISCNSNQVQVNALPIRKVQTISVNINDVNEVLTIDSGSEGNCMRYETCKKLKLPVRPLDVDDKSVPTQADGESLLEIVGQTEFVATRGNVSFHWTGYVAKTLSAAILCGRTLYRGE